MRFFVKFRRSQLLNLERHAPRGKQRDLVNAVLEEESSTTSTDSTLLKLHLA